MEPITGTASPSHYEYQDCLQFARDGAGTSVLALEGNTAGNDVIIAGSDGIGDSGALGGVAPPQQLQLNDTAASDYDSIDIQQAPPAADVSLKQSNLTVVYSEALRGVATRDIFSVQHDIDVTTELDDADVTAMGVASSEYVNVRADTDTDVDKGGYAVPAKGNGTIGCSSELDDAIVTATGMASSEYVNVRADTGVDKGGYVVPGKKNDLQVAPISSNGYSTTPLTEARTGVYADEHVGAGAVYSISQVYHK